MRRFRNHHRGRCPSRASWTASRTISTAGHSTAYRRITSTTIVSGNVHGGGSYGNKLLALEAFARNLGLSPRARSQLRVENDDRLFTPADLLPLFRSEGLPMVYDVHHHRCRTDSLNLEDATIADVASWDREPSRLMLPASIMSTSDR